jgi:predicted dithiol-disulfide oxidoreductase (DUF899 family)
MPTVLDEVNVPQAVVSPDKWLAARKALLEREKQLTHLHDEVAELRRRLPWVKVTKTYSFQTPCGAHPLSDLFGDQSQLLVYHFMFGPQWKEGCPSCSMVADQLNAIAPHVAQRDVSLMLVSRAPLEELRAFKARMRWNNLMWASSDGSDFNQDFGVALNEAQIQSGKFYNYGTQPFPVDEAPGLSAFIKRGNDIYHTYSTYGRGLEGLLGVYALLDVAPLGRNEADLPNPMAWVKHHDKYPDAGANAAALPVAAEKSSCGCQ